MKLLFVILIFGVLMFKTNEYLAQKTLNYSLKSSNAFTLQSPLVLNNKDILNYKPSEDFKPSKLKQFIIPTAFIAYGATINLVPNFKQTDYKVRDLVTSNIDRKYHFDDWLQYAPLAGVFGLDLVGVKSQHRLLDKVLVTGTSALLMAGMVNSIKYSAKVLRPDNTSRNSFPSGHTATVFFSAHILFKEYKQTSPWIGITGYALATTTAIFRVINNRHWVSDIIGGAGVAILSVELSYLLLPTFKRWLHIDQPKTNKITPFALPNYTGMNYSIDASRIGY